MNGFPKVQGKISAKGSYFFDLLKKGIPDGISFRGIPSGHESSSLLLAILNADVKWKNLPDEGLRWGIGRVKGHLDFKTYFLNFCNQWA